jgi:hypothetical protein
MKKILVCLSVLLFFPAYIAMSDLPTPSASCPTPITIDADARGCCSYHGGVCGCSATGRAICCDGQLSPSCGC